MKQLDEIIGEEQIIDYFKQAIGNKSVGHAYVFEGEEGSGKKTLAYTFAKMLECEEGSDEPCGKCKSCLMADGLNHPDIITITHESPRHFGVDELRNQLVSEMGVKPYHSRYKIFIVPDAEIMTDQAQNAILKTIEEPSEHGIVMLLTTNAGRFLPTIMSRCVKLTVKPIDPLKVYNYLKENYSTYPDGSNVSEEDFRFATAYAQGNIGKGIRAIENPDFKNVRDIALSAVKNIHNLEIPDMVFSAKNAADYKLQLMDYFDIMKLWFRDVLMLKVTKNIDQLVLKDMYSYMNKQASVVSYEGIELILEALDNAKIRLDSNVDVATVLELLLFRIKEQLKWVK
ncbi:MAG: DNA polymerase III subunit delta [Lachnospiraceae bacterium]|nr:DNA polymerase III subunit delta [Lachnospiraceae bacterium]